MLAINTAFMTANLGLCTKDGVVVTRDVDANSKHSENMLKTIDEMCQEAKIDILDVETVAVVVGPGSFTGLRIGTAVAKALGCVNEMLKFEALSSLGLMAYIIAKHKLCKGKFACVINALSDLFFVAYFDENGISIQNEALIERTEFEKIYVPKFALKGDLTGEDVFEIEITAKDLLEFAKEEERQKKFVKIEEMVPKYLRLSQAEDNLKKKQKKD